GTPRRTGSAWETARGRSSRRCRSGARTPAAPTPARTRAGAPPPSPPALRSIGAAVAVAHVAEHARRGADADVGRAPALGVGGARLVAFLLVVADRAGAAVDVAHAGLHALPAGVAGLAEQPGLAIARRHACTADGAARADFSTRGQRHHGQQANPS